MVSSYLADRSAMNSSHFFRLDRESPDLNGAIFFLPFPVYMLSNPVRLVPATTLTDSD